LLTLDVKQISHDPKQAIRNSSYGLSLVNIFHFCATANGWPSAYSQRALSPVEERVEEEIVVEEVVVVVVVLAEAIVLQKILVEAIWAVIRALL